MPVVWYHPTTDHLKPGVSLSFTLSFPTFLGPTAIVASFSTTRTVRKKQGAPSSDKVLSDSWLRLHTRQPTDDRRPSQDDYAPPLVRSLDQSEEDISRQTHLSSHHRFLVIPFQRTTPLHTRFRPRYLAIATPASSRCKRSKALRGLAGLDPVLRGFSWEISTGSLDDHHP